MTSDELVNKECSYLLCRCVVIFISNIYMYSACTAYLKQYYTKEFDKKVNYSEIKYAIFHSESSESFPFPDVIP